MLRGKEGPQAGWALDHSNIAEVALCEFSDSDHKSAHVFSPHSYKTDAREEI